MKFIIITASVAIILLSSCTPSVRFASVKFSKIAASGPEPDNVTSVITGKASYYSDKFHGRRTASGSTYNKNELTAAHRTLDFGTIVRVTNILNNKIVVVKITDRGPFVTGREIDLSRAAAEQLGMIQSGVIDVKIEVLE